MAPLRSTDVITTADGINLRADLLVSGMEDIADIEEVGTVPLKGFHAPVPVFNVVGLRGAFDQRRLAVVEDAQVVVVPAQDEVRHAGVVAAQQTGCR